MLRGKEVAEFHKMGFLNAGPCLGMDRVEKLREGLQRVIEGKQRPDVPQPVLLRNLGTDEARPVWQIVNVWEVSEPFKVLLSESKIVEEVGQLTWASELRVWHDQIQYKPAGFGGLNMWHQDAPFWPILEPMTQVSAWVALDDVDETNCCMSMVAGSHLWGDRINFLSSLKDFEEIPSEFEGHEIKIVPCPVRRGEVHYHHALTWHGSQVNQSDT